MTLTAAYVAFNEEAAIAESMRSVKAYVDRFVIIDSAFASNPRPGPIHSTDHTRYVAARIAGDKPLAYIMPTAPLYEDQARDLYLDAVKRDDWLLIIDADEVLCGDHDAILELIASLPDRKEAVSLAVFTNAVLFDGNADEMSPDHYETGPIISTVGMMPRLVRNVAGLRHRRVLDANGRASFSSLWVGDRLLDERASDAAFLINRHVAQSYDGYLDDFRWESAQEATR